MTVREVSSSDGTPIVYRTFGPESARPLVLLHGWAQSSRCWGEEVLGDLARNFRVIALDLRGHGYSGAPREGYDNSENWAADVHAVLEAENADDAVLLGWSYGGLVICDYLTKYGSAKVSGVVLVGAITSIGRGERGGKVGAAMRAAIPAAMSEKPREAIAALGSFGNALTGPPQGKGVVSQALFGASLSTAPHVRAALFDRSVSNDDLLRSLEIPVLLLHGTADSVVDVSAARHAESLLPNASTSYWEGVDHGPFVEDPARFVAEVTEFVESVDA
ncbi:alpha/beta hydrolase [Rhodococcus sp. HNM0563]|uniref:alpha/beta fold hydrolase n=1 Tax=unclassified Rhodococcus (in: high G+C Gram-positive bacteria) TaxID=192944 RepID=UPI00146AE531|nr:MULTISPECIES: alpha/beta hydrolase [unclassified Rhodococcus (in: high G+C Gram-positive bacteria)]MCK0090127.1 alpha/beta hydrolase [Rhodococcus sp. F64268]NLU64654.1 alpha/beta hydrolase [Rhodococcus sp. HNM0563]